jgi:hypothetical protein
MNLTNRDGASLHLRLDRVTADWGSGVSRTESGVNGASGRADTGGFPPARTGEKQSLPRSVTGLDGRNSSEFAGAGRNVAGLVSAIVIGDDQCDVEECVDVQVSPL